MPKNEALQEMKNELHVSHSQIFTYLNCSLKYRFMYVEARPQERVSIALAVWLGHPCQSGTLLPHVEGERIKEPLGVLLNLFEHHINLEMDRTDIPIVFKKETPDRDAVIDMGNAMLEAFHEGVNLSGFEILDIERPLSARLYTDEGQPTDLKLIGVLDLVLKDEAGRIIAVDNKTAAKPYAQATVDDDNQLTCYAYLLGGESVRVPHRRCPLPVGCSEKTQNAQAGAVSHRPHGGSAPPVRQACHCRSRRNRSPDLHAPTVMDVQRLRLRRRL